MEVSVLEEQRSHRVRLLVVLAVFAAVAAWRGWSAAPVIAALFGVGALALAVGAVLWHRVPPSRIEVGDDAITWSRAGSEPIVFLRADSARLELARLVTTRGAGPWSLRRPDDASGPRMDLFGYHVAVVHGVCESHGWEMAPP